MEESTETIQDLPEPVVPPEVPAAEAPEPEPKKRGRTAGAKDRAPRKKNITIVEEPLQHEPPQAQEVPSVPEAPEILPSHPVEVPEPFELPSPRTGLIHAQRRYHEAIHGGVSKQTKADERYSKRLALTHQIVSCR